jgi:hypothetical protein
MIFDDPALCTERILHPTEPVSIYSRLPEDRIFFNLKPHPPRIARRRTIPVPRPPRTKAENFLLTRLSPRSSAGPAGQTPWIAHLCFPKVNNSLRQKSGDSEKKSCDRIQVFTFLHTSV